MGDPSKKNRYFSRPPILLCVVAGLFLLAVQTGCSVGNDYAKHMKELADHARSLSPDAPAALETLLSFSRSADYWERYYGIVYLGQVAMAENDEKRRRIAPVLIKALSDKAQAIQREAVSSIRDMGSEVVDQAVPELTQFVKSRDERDVSWFAAAALGESRNIKNRTEVVSTLMDALDKAPLQTEPSAPQIRYYALSSLVELGLINQSDILPELKKRATTNDSMFASKIANAVSKLEAH